MAEPQLALVVRRLRHLTGAAPGGELTDAQLLGRFTGAREEAAFAALLERHSRLVWGVCRHLLRQEQDAEDAFQATFLVLANKAAAIRKGDALASWLYGVAYRVALKARTRAPREPMARPAPPPPPSPAAEAALREVQAILDDEVRLLPEKLRAPFVLCCLEGRSKAEAARELGWKEGTVSGRLAQARDRLRTGLARRGVGLSAALTATALAEGATAAVPAAARAAVLAVVAGKAAGSSASALSLAEGVMQSMVSHKFRGALFLLLLASLGLGCLSHAMRAAPAEEASTAVAPPEAKAGKPAEVGAPAGPPVRLDRVGDPLPPGALARMGTLRLRHGDVVTSVVYAPDGKFVAAAGQDRTVRLWSPETGKELACLRGHAGTIQALALSRDGKVLASAGHDGTVCLWDIKAGRPGPTPRRLLGHEGFVMAVHFTPDGKSLISGGYDGSIRVWDVAGGKEVRSFGKGKGRVRSLALAPGGKVLASVNLVGDYYNPVASIQFWDVATGKHDRQFIGGQKGLHQLAFSPDGETIAASGNEGVKVWEVASGGTLVKLRDSHLYTPCVLFAPNGRTLVTGGGGFLREWRLPTGRPGRSFDVGDIYTYSGAFSPDGKTLVTGTTRSVDLWDFATGKRRHSFVGHDGEVTALLFSPDSKELLTGGFGRPLYRWEAATGRKLGQLTGPRSGYNSTLALSPDGKTLAALGNDLAIVLLDVKTGKERLKFTKHLPPRTSAQTLQHVVFAPDGRTIYSSTLGVDRNIRQWEVATGKEVQVIPTGPGNSSGLAISPDGKLLYSVTLNGPIHVMDAATGKELRQFGKQGWGVRPLLLSPDGRRLAGVLIDGVHVWDTTTGLDLFPPLQARGHQQQLAFAPDGRTLAVIGNGGGERVRFFEMATGQLRLELGGHVAPVKAIAFSPDGRRFATGSGDTTALVWDYYALPLVREQLAKELSPVRLNELFGALSSSDGVAAFRAVCALARAPKQAVPFLAARLGQGDAKTIAELIAQLGDEELSVRQKAMKELTALGPAAEAALRKAQAASPDVDVRLRAGVVLRNLERAEGNKRLTRLRALEVLEIAGTPEARRLVEGLAAGAAELEWTKEAKAALSRMGAKRKVSP